MASIQFPENPTMIVLFWVHGGKEIYVMNRQILVSEVDLEEKENHGRKRLIMGGKEW